MTGRIRGFTFPEVLAAIALILVLMSMLLPEFVRSTALGRRTHCLTNLSQLCGALHLYAMDYDGTLPPTANFQSPLQPYIKSDPVMECPERLPRPGAYSYRPGLANDDPPTELLAADDAPRHSQGCCRVTLGGRAYWQHGLAPIPAVPSAPDRREPR